MSRVASTAAVDPNMRTIELDESFVDRCAAHPSYSNYIYLN